MVAAYAQHLGTLLLDLAVVLPEQGGLLRSPGGEVKHVEGEDHVFLPSVLAEGDVAVIHRGQLEVRGHVSYFCWHLSPFPLLMIEPTRLCRGEL